MVRTLVFHTNNVGSIPTGLKMLSIKRPLYPLTTILPIKKNFTSKHIDSNFILSLHKITTPTVITPLRYSFRFTSLVPPLPKAFDSLPPIQSNNSPLPKRLLIKRSYLVLSWINYITILGTQKRKHFKPNIAVLPSDTRVYTLAKAPMAHKTNSKEQFLVKFYNFKFSFELASNPKAAARTVQQGAYVMHLTKQLFPVFETNLLTLKYYEVRYPVGIRSTLSSRRPISAIKP
jgi:hypothetical protein